LKAHAKWLILGKVMQFIPGIDRLVDGVGLNQAKQISMGFGGVIILILLYINRSRYANRVTQIFELGSNLIVSYEFDIHRALEQQQFFNIDHPVAAAKLEFLKERVSELWELFWTDLSNGGDDRKHVWLTRTSSRPLTSSNGPSAALCKGQRVANAAVRACRKPGINLRTKRRI
jgi:hypothetical protein